MADPLSIVMTVASTALGMMSSASAASAQSEQADAAARAAAYNEQVSRQNAQNVMLATNANEDAKRRESAVRKGALRASLIESGVGITDGSGADLVEQSTLNSEMDALNIRYQGLLQSRGYSAQADLDAMEGSAAKKRSSAAIRGGMIGGAGAVLSGAGKYIGPQSSKLT